jgi:hypothetical protein
VVEDDPVGVVDDVGFVAELHGLAQASLADRTSVDVVETDQPTGVSRSGAAGGAGCWGGNKFGQLRGCAQRWHRARRSAARK